MGNFDIYTDGACSGNPGPGGWAFALVGEEEILHSEFGSAKNTTNNKMELIAIINGLSYILKEKGEGSLIRIHTDSAYCMNAMKSWVHNWIKRGWKKANGDVIENIELIKGLYELCYESNIKVEFVKVKAHQKKNSEYYNYFNEFVDELARNASLS